LRSTAFAALGRRGVTLLAAGLLIRELFSFWTGHPTDFELWVRLGYAMSHGGNPYGVLAPVPGLSFANVFSADNAPTIAYPPFWPIITGLVYLLYSLNGWNDRFFYYFLLKQPVILGDIALAYLLFSYVYSKKSANQAFWVLSFWLFSPFTIIISGIWGMFDSIAIALVILAIMSTSELKRVFWTGLGVFVKSIPVIYAAPVTMRRARDLPAAIASVGLAGLLSIGTIVIMKMPLQVATTTLESTASTGGWSMSVWDAVFYLNYLGLLPSSDSPAYRVLGLIWVPALIIFTWVAFKRFGTQTDYGLVQSLLVCTLAFLIFRARVTEQYALYLFALGAVDIAVWNPARKSTLTGTVVVALFYLVINNYFLVRFLSPIYPGFVNFENMMYNTIGPLRYALTFVTGIAFTCLNIRYLVTVLRRG